MNIEQTLDKIRDAISQCDASEKDLFEALDCEAEGWRMRLQELEDEDEGL